MATFPHRWVLFGAAPPKVIRSLRGKSRTRKGSGNIWVSTAQGLLVVTYQAAKGEKVSESAAQQAVATFIGKHGDAVNVIGFTRHNRSGQPLSKEH
jgi:hypothetical protein